MNVWGGEGICFISLQTLELSSAKVVLTSMTLYFKMFCEFPNLEMNKVEILMVSQELQIRGGIEDNPKIIFLIFQQKHML